MSGKKRWPDILIGLMLLLALGCAALAIVAGDKKARQWGPRILEQSAIGDVWFVYNQELLIARPDGTLLHRVSLSALKLPGPVNAIVPLASRDGEARMLVGVIKHPEWLIMNSEGVVIERLKPHGSDVPFNETFHLAAAPDGRIAMSTGGDHRVLLFDAQGKFLEQTTPGLLRFANGLWYENGQWWVVNTNHRQDRILNGTTLKPELVLTVPYSGGYKIPALGRRSKAERDTITLSVMRNDMQHGIVVDINRSGELVRTYRSPAKHPQPADFLWLGNELLVTENDGFALHLFDQGGGHLKTWGDNNIQSALKQAHRERLLWGSVLLSAQAGSIILGLVAIIAYFGWKQFQQHVPELAQSDSRLQLTTPSLSRWDEFIAYIILFWPLYLAMLPLLALLWGLDLLVIPLATFLKQLSASWLIPVLGASLVLIAVALTGLVVFTVRFMQQRMNLPRFEAALAARAVRWFKHTKTVQEALGSNEFAQEVLMVRSAGLFPGFNMKIWVLTNFRMLIFDLSLGATGKLWMAHARNQISARIDSAGPTWLRWTAKQDALHIQLRDGRTFSGYPVSPLTARRVADLLAFSHTTPSDPAMAGSPPAELRSPKPIAAFALSLLVPGLAQMRQDRLRLGLILLVGMLTAIAFLLTPVLLGWIGHFYDVSLGNKIAPILFYTLWAFFAAADAWRYARGVHGLTPCTS